ncbi:MAG TPA: Ger(x)C family spore germination protein [Desulfobacteria bacterium]|nr:Ger(x)C family spore germination protein [Desulfobacteria bacterium]
MKVRNLTFAGIIVLLFMSITLISGCWDSTEPDNLATVLGIGMDQGNEGEIQLTLQIISPASSKGGDQEPQPGQQPVIVLSAEGKSLEDAIKKLQKDFPRRLYFAHAKIIVFGRKLAAFGIDTELDDLYRGREFRGLDWIIVADNTAREVLQTKVDTEKLPAKGIDDMMTEFKKVAVSYPINVNEFLLRSKNPARASFAPLVRLEARESGQQLGGDQAKSNEDKSVNQKKLTFGKTAVFRNYHLVGTITTEETSGLLLLLNQLTGEVVQVPVRFAGGSEGEISLRIVKGRTRISPVSSDEQIKFEISGYAEAEITGSPPVGLDLTDPAELQKIAAQVEQILTQRVEATLTRAQQNLDTDFVGFADTLNRSNPTQWQELKPDWDKKFPDVPYSINLSIRISNIGKVQQPTTELERGD